MAIRKKTPPSKVSSKVSFIDNIWRKYNSEIKIGFIALFVILGLWLMIIIFTPKPQIPAEYKILIDSLTKSNNIIIQQQKSIDSNINIYQNKIDGVDVKISNIQEKTIYISKHYGEKNQKINNFTPTQIDSFFRNRYNY
jgi:hypothetical protein